MPVALKGATSGQVTLDVPAAAGTNTLTLPAKTGNIITSADSGTVTQAMLASNVAGNGPAFMAYMSANQTISNNTWTKVNFNTVRTNGDTNSNYSTSLYKFTPTVAGYYSVSASVDGGGTGLVYVHVYIYKNGTSYKLGGPIYSGSTSTYTEMIACTGGVIYMNGSSDYLEVYGRSNASSGNIIYATDASFFEAALLRSA